MFRLGFRAVIFFGMLVSLLLSIFTGFILYLWPHGPQSGKLLFLGATKLAWIDIHTYLSLLAVIIMVTHIILNRRFVKLYYKWTVKREKQ